MLDDLSIQQQQQTRMNLQGASLSRIDDNFTSTCSSLASVSAIASSSETAGTAATAAGTATATPAGGSGSKTPSKSRGKQQKKIVDAAEKVKRGYFDRGMAKMRMLFG